MDIGIAKPTNNEFLNPKKKNRTTITNIIPIIILFSRLLT